MKGQCGVTIVLQNGAQVQLVSTMTKQQIIEAHNTARSKSDLLRIPTANETPGQQNEEVFTDPKNISFMSLCELVEQNIVRPQMSLQTSFGKGGQSGRSQ